MTNRSATMMTLCLLFSLGAGCGGGSGSGIPYGTGSPTASLQPSSLNFSSQPVDTTSAPQAVTLTNTGNNALAVNDATVTIVGPFVETNNCGTSLAPHGSCTFQVTFTPTASGPDLGFLTFDYNLFLGEYISADFAGTGAVGGGGPSSNPTPNISALFPLAAAAGAAAQTLAITGSGFVSASTVDFNGIGHAVTFVSSSELAIQLSASDQATAGAYAVVVTNPAPGGGESNAVDFILTNPSQSGSLTGNWSFNFQSSVSGATNSGYGYLSQGGNGLGAFIHVDGAGCFSTAQLTGSVSASTVNFTLAQLFENDNVGGFLGTASTDGNSMSGAYTVSGSCGQPDHGTWIATRTTASACVAAPLGLVSWWRGEGNAADQLGLNAGSVVGGVSYAAGEVGDAFQFDGLTGYVNVPDSASLDAIKGQETVEMWINPTSVVGGSAGSPQPQFLYARRNPQVSESFSVYIQTNGALGLLVHTSSSATPTGTKFETAAGVIKAGQFQHIVVSLNTAVGVPAFYVNGVPAPATATFGSPLVTGNLTVVPDLYLGRWQDNSVSGGNSGSYYGGLLDEVSLYSTALDIAQAQYLFEAGHGGKCVQ